MHDVSGVTGAAPLWARTFDFLAKRPDFNKEAPPVPASLVVRSSGAGRVVYLPGTEPLSVVAPIEIEARTATIVSPVEGTVIALDPDIPEVRQRVLFESYGVAHGSAWVLNDKDLGPAERPYLWAPEPGLYVLSLRSVDGREVSSVRFSVRGKG